MILSGERPFDGPVTLTAEDAVRFGDIAGVAAELTGRDIRRVVTDDEEWVAGQVAHGTPEFLARFLLGTFQAARQGRFAGTGMNSDIYRRILSGMNPVSRISARHPRHPSTLRSPGQP